MGGELRECGCYDGPFSEEDRAFVSIRCADHLEDGPRDGAPLMLRMADGRIIDWPPRVHQPPRMAIPKTRKPKKRRRGRSRS